jgi:hypothetical protein
MCFCLAQALLDALAPKEMLALMKKKAEAEARESLELAADRSLGDSVTSSASVPDDAKELIAAMQNQSSACAADAGPSNKSLKSDSSQKSRARRLTSTTVAMDDASQMQNGGVRESSGNGMWGVVVWLGCT